MKNDRLKQMNKEIIFKHQEVDRKERLCGLLLAILVAVGLILFFTYPLWI